MEVSFTDTFVKAGIACGVIEYRDRKDARHALEELDGRRIDGHKYRARAIKAWD